MTPTLRIPWLPVAVAIVLTVIALHLHGPEPMLDPNSARMTPVTAEPAERFTP